MKRTLSMMLVMVSIMCLSSCSEEEQRPVYSIRCDTVHAYSEKLHIFECDAAGDKIYDHTITNVIEGKTYTFTAVSEIVKKVKIYISVESFWGDYNKWVQRVFYLDEGKSTNIVITSNTLIGPNEP